MRKKAAGGVNAASDHQCFLEKAVEAGQIRIVRMAVHNTDRTKAYLLQLPLKIFRIEAGRIRMMIFRNFTLQIPETISVSIPY